MHSEIPNVNNPDQTRPMSKKFCPERYLLNLFRKAGYQVTPEPDMSLELAVLKERVKIVNEMREQMDIAEWHAILGPEFVKWLGVDQPSVDASIFIEGTFDDEEWLARQRVLFQAPDVQRLLVLFREADASPCSAETNSDAL